MHFITRVISPRISPSPNERHACRPIQNGINVKLSKEMEHLHDLYAQDINGIRKIGNMKNSLCYFPSIHCCFRAQFAVRLQYSRMHPLRHIGTRIPYCHQVQIASQSSTRLSYLPTDVNLCTRCVKGSSIECDTFGETSYRVLRCGVCNAVWPWCVRR